MYKRRMRVKGPLKPPSNFGQDDKGWQRFMMVSKHLNLKYGIICVSNVFKSSMIILKVVYKHNNHLCICKIIYMVNWSGKFGGNDIV